MIEEEINRILTSDKAHQWKAIQLQNLGKQIYDQFNSEDFKSKFEKLAPDIRVEIEKRQLRVSEIEKMIKENETILKQKEEIERRYNQLKAESDKLDELKRKNEALKKLSLVQAEVSIASDEKDALIKKHIETLTALNQVLVNANSDLEKQLDSKTKDASNHLTTVLISLDTAQFKNKFSELEKSVNNLVTDYNYHVKKITTVKEDIETITKEYDKVISVFNIHHLENENIFGALKNREGVLQHVRKISDEISERLKQYDSEIKSLVEKRDQLPIYQLAEARKYK
ncbi:MAG: hypothetical protein JWQ09_3142 [Segetibacter sp.]|nr:hypothetical protein [Segetibacter sp.]